MLSKVALICFFLCFSLCRLTVSSCLANCKPKHDYFAKLSLDDAKASYGFHAELCSFKNLMSFGLESLKLKLGSVR